MRAGHDAGLADAYWRQYFSAEEVAELEAAIRPTGLVYEDTPVHVRVYHHDADAPTIVAPHGLIVYGFLCARVHLEFFRAGWNVVSWDFPGFGQSGGPRNGPTIGSMIEVWKMMIDWASEQYGGRQVHMVGLAEDGVTGYYASANNPLVKSISVHHLLEFGDLDNIAWVNPRWWRWVQGKGLAVLEKIAPWVQFDAEKAVPWDAIFSSEEDQAAYQLYKRDPLRIQRYNVHLARDLFRPRRPPVPFEVPYARAADQLRAEHDLAGRDQRPHVRTARRREGAGNPRGDGPVVALARVRRCLRGTRAALVRAGWRARPG